MTPVSPSVAPPASANALDGAAVASALNSLLAELRQLREEVADLRKKQQATSPAAAASLSPQQQFQLEEFKALREEINKAVAAFQRYEQWAVLGALAVWSWLAARPDPLPGLLGYAWFIPLAIAVATFRQVFFLVSEIRTLGSHIATIEQSFGYLGWETNLRKATPRHATFWNARNLIFWVPVFLITLAVPLHVLGYIQLPWWLTR
jgi:hypothetical protein